MSAASAIVAARDKGVRRSRLEILARQGIHCRPASTATEIFTLTAHQPPDLLLLDVELGGEDGVETCRRLKSHETFRAPVVLCLPGAMSGFRRQAALESGADAYLAEPTEPEVLMALTHAMLRISHADRELRRDAERIERLERQLAEARQEAEQFAAHACHDVEEPLRGVTTFVQLVDERHPGMLSGDERTYLRHVLASGDRVRRLLRGFLAYCRVGRVPHARFGAVDLGIVAAGALRALRPRLHEAKAGLQIEGSLPTVLGDFGELQQVFEQVIGNAIDYSRATAVPAIRIGAQSGGPRQSVISVSDNGPGVPPDRNTAIFQPFKRLHGREISGAGMGLAIAKKVVEMHGGRMWVESASGRGSRFCFSLPVFEEDSAQKRGS